MEREGSEGCFIHTAGQCQPEACCHPVGFPACLSETKKGGTETADFQIQERLGLFQERKGFIRCSGFGQGLKVQMGVYESHTLSFLKNITMVAPEK